MACAGEDGGWVGGGWGGGGGRGRGRYTCVSEQTAASGGRGRGGPHRGAAARGRGAAAPRPASRTRLCDLEQQRQRHEQRRRAARLHDELERVHKERRLGEDVRVELVVARRVEDGAPRGGAQLVEPRARDVAQPARRPRARRKVDLEVLLGPLEAGVGGLGAGAGGQLGRGRGLRERRHRPRGAAEREADRGASPRGSAAAGAHAAGRQRGGRAAEPRAHGGAQNERTEGSARRPPRRPWEIEAQPCVWWPPRRRGRTRGRLAHRVVRAAAHHAPSRAAAPARGSRGAARAASRREAADEPTPTWTDEAATHHKDGYRPREAPPLSKALAEARHSLRSGKGLSPCAPKGLVSVSDATPALAPPTLLRAGRPARPSAPTCRAEEL